MDLTFCANISSSTVDKAAVYKTINKLKLKQQRMIQRKIATILYSSVQLPRSSLL